MADECQDDGGGESILRTAGKYHKTVMRKLVTADIWWEPDGGVYQLRTDQSGMFSDRVGVRNRGGPLHPLLTLFDRAINTVYTTPEAFSIHQSLARLIQPSLPVTTNGHWKSLLPQLDVQHLLKVYQMVKGFPNGRFNLKRTVFYILH